MNYSLNQPRELSAGMMHVPLGFLMTGGIEDIQTGEITEDGARKVLISLSPTLKFIKMIYFSYLS